LSKKEGSGWFNKKDIGIISLIIVFAIIGPWFSDDEPKVKKQPVKAYSATQPTQSSNYGFIVIDSVNQDVPMRVYPDSTVDYSRIPVNTKLKVLDKKVTSMTKWLPNGITWYKVKYNGVSGWVSEFVTNLADLHN
jgi:hypothetical protein